jgi:hypothetical protein
MCPMQTLVELQVQAGSGRSPLDDLGVKWARGRVLVSGRSSSPAIDLSATYVALISPP